MTPIKDSIFTIVRARPILPASRGPSGMPRTSQRPPVTMSGELTARIMFAGRSSSLSAQIVSHVRDALFAKQIKPGDFLGTEKDLAAQFGTSRIVARDALRTLEALGSVEIRMGKGGGARIAHGNPRLFAEALAVQLDLTGVSAAEIMDEQRAIDTLGAALAAEHASAGDIAKLRRLRADAEAAMHDLDLFTRLSRDFHLAVAEASHNRVIVVQLLSLEHISWPRRNPTATPKLARHILEIHSQLVDLIELRDASAARALMNDHVKMIRARRVAEHGHLHEVEKSSCCKRCRSTVLR